MTPKERFFATINNKLVDRPATCFGLSAPEPVTDLLKYFNCSSISEINTKLEDDIWPVIVPYNNHPHNDIGCALSFAKEGIDGSQDKHTLTAPGYFENMTDPAEVDKYDWPNPKDHLDTKESLEKAKAIPENYVRMGIIFMLWLPTCKTINYHMKDNHTIANKPENVTNWCKIVREEIDKLYS